MSYTQEIEAARLLLEEALAKSAPIKPSKPAKKRGADKVVFTGTVMIGQLIQNFASG